MTLVPSGGWGRKGGSIACMSLAGDGGGEEDLSHVSSGGALRISAMYPAGVLSNTCPQWGMGEERRISVMYPVGDAQSLRPGSFLVTFL